VNRMVFLYEVCTKSAFLMGSVRSMEVNEHPSGLYAKVVK
jgi:hypothetical protein